MVYQSFILERPALLHTLEQSGGRVRTRGRIDAWIFRAVVVVPAALADGGVQYGNKALL